MKTSFNRPDTYGALKARYLNEGESFERFHFQKPVFNGSNGYRRRENLGVANLCKQVTKGNVMEIVGNID